MARTILVGALVCLALTLAQTAGAQTPRPEPSARKEYRLSVDAQPLTRALEQLYGQTEIFYGYSPNSEEEEQTIVGPLKGTYTIEKALTELLRPTNLTFTWTNSRQISIVRKPPAPKVVPPTVKVPTRRPQPQPARSDESEEGKILDWVYTERSRIKSLRESAGSYVIIDREAIERSGFMTVSDLLKYLPQQPYLRPDGFSSSGAQYAELRGLGADTTLVLLSGRRAFASAGSFVVNAFDLNTVPLSAVERVEVLFDSTSVRHGMDAIGGVLNIVLRDEIPEPIAQVHYGSAQGGAGQFQMSTSAGYKRDAVKIAVTADYLLTQTLLGAERDLWANQNYRRFGSTDQRSLTSSPGNVIVPGLPPRVGGIVAPGVVDFAEPNYESLMKFTPIVPAMSRKSLVANAQVELWPTDMVANGEFMYVDRSVRAPSLLPLVLPLPVPATNPFNRFGMPVIVIGLLEGMEPLEQNIDSTLTRGVASLQGKARAWDWEIALVRSEEDAELAIENTINVPRYLQVLFNPLPDQTLDLFRPGPAASQEILDSLVAPPIVSNYATDATQVSGLATGRLFELPGGLVTAMVGGEWRKESVDFDSALDSFEREVAAGFAELTIPVVGEDMHVPALRELQLTAGGRLDDYTDFGQIFNPQFGVRWLPYADLSLHASYGRSFRPPSMYELHLPRQEGQPAFPVADPRRGGATTVVALITGGNPELEPTRGESFTAGLTFRPQVLDPVELFATYWHVTMDDRVTLLPPTLVLANEALFPERVLRAEPTPAELAAGLAGSVLKIDVSRMNFGRLATSGIDLGVRYEIESRFGQFSGNAVATWIGEYETVDVPATPAASRVNVANETVGTITKWRAVGGLNWDLGSLSATMHVRYIPSYDDTRGGVRNGRRIGAQTFVDLQTAVHLGKLIEGSKLLSGVELAAGASNLLDQHPDFAEVGGVRGYDMSQGDLKGRFWYVRLGKAF